MEDAIIILNSKPQCPSEGLYKWISNFLEVKNVDTQNKNKNGYSKTQFS